MHKRIEAQNALDRRKEVERERLKVEKAARKGAVGMREVKWKGV